LEVSIKDDGRGFDPVKVKAGIGLKNINSRLQVFSGSMNIDSAPGKGCELKAHFNIQ
jgi:signal transduction histidine kinase